MNNRSRETSFRFPMGIRYSGIIGASLALLAGPVSAQVSGGSERLERCANIRNDTERLACFDTYMANRSEIERERLTTEFGLSDRDKAKASPDRAPPEEPKIESVVQSLTVSPIGKRIVRLENGQIWEETNPSTLRGTIRSGVPVTITKGALGSYRLTTSSRTGFLSLKRLR